MALSPLADALTAVAAGLAFGVAAVIAVVLPVSRAWHRPHRSRHRRPSRGQPGRLAHPDVIRHPPATGPAKDRQPRRDSPGPIGPHDVGDLLVDLERPGVTVARGPAALVNRILTAVAAERAAQVPTRSFELIVTGFAAAAPGAMSCADLAEALDLVAASAVTARRRRAAARRADPGGTAVRGRTIVPPDAADQPLTVLVSLIAPQPAELKLLIDLAAEPRGCAALLPIPVHQSPDSARVRDLGHDPARSGVIAADPRAAVRPRTAVAPPAAARSGRASLRIGVLGALTINGQPAALLPAQSQLIVALALHGSGGLSNRQLCHLLGADPSHPRPSDSLRQLIARTRRQLGRSADGLEWIGHRGHGQYALHPAATVDWLDFDAATSHGIQARDAQQLTAAMAMIRGQPFSGCFYWWLDLTLIETVRSRIVDAAGLLAELDLAAGKPAAAARAARTGLVADEAAERLWRALMRAEHAAGNATGVREAWTRCLHAISDIAPDGQPGQQTATLYQRLVGR